MYIVHTYKYIHFIMYDRIKCGGGPTLGGPPLGGTPLGGPLVVGPPAGGLPGGRTAGGVGGLAGEWKN